MIFDILHEIKNNLSKTFMKDLNEASFVLNIKLQRDMSHGMSRVSHKPILNVYLKGLT